jgi:hypothetical protein
MLIDFMLPKINVRFDESRRIYVFYNSITYFSLSPIFLRFLGLPDGGSTSVAIGTTSKL